MGYQYWAMAEELKAVRPLVKAAMRHRSLHGPRHLGCDICTALAVYDHAPKAVLDFRPEQQPADKEQRP